MKKLFKISFLIVLLPLFLAAQGRDEEGFIQSDTIGKQKNIKLLAIPILFYTPETKFGFGGGGQMFLLNNTNKSLVSD